MSDLRFYFDESVELAVSVQLAAGGLDIVSAHSLGKLGVLKHYNGSPRPRLH